MRPEPQPSPQSADRNPEATASSGSQPDDVPTLDSPSAIENTSAVQSHFAAGRMIGPCKMVRRLGQGGMGEVWLAEQTHPVRRRVALKLIKTGMNTQELVARFESERQALAIMEHPAIAHVYDASSTPEGHPYFAME